MIVHRKLVLSQIKNLIFQRNITLLANTQTISSDWLKAKSNAENVVGYSFSYFNLKSLLNQELANIASYFQDNLGIDNPLVQTAKKLVFTENFAYHTKGLIILLISQVASHIQALESNEKLPQISPKQRTLAKITEMVYFSHLIHRKIKYIPHELLVKDKSYHDAHLKNNISILSSDFLLATVWKLLCDFKNVPITAVMTKCISDFMEGQYIIETEKDYPSQFDCIEYWKKRNFLMNASLQAGSCQSALILGDFDEVAQLKAYEFGKNFAFFWQIFIELLPFVELFDSSQEFGSLDLMSAPVLAHVYLTGDKLFNLNSKSLIKREKVYSIIKSGPGVAKAREMRDDFAQKSLEALSYFPPSQATSAINYIIQSIKSQ